LNIVKNIPLARMEYAFQARWNRIGTIRETIRRLIYAVDIKL